MPFITTPDGTDLYYTEQGEGQPVVFSHGWPLSSDAWQRELKVFADAGYRAIAHDRRGHGRSARPYQGNDMDTYAADLAALVDQLGLDDILLVGHSTGGGEVVRFAAQHGAGRVRKVATVGAVPPVMLQSETNPEGTPLAAFDGFRESVLNDRSQLWHEIAVPFFGANRDGSQVSQGARDDFWRQGMNVGLQAAYDCIKAFSETDFTEDLKALDVPVLVAHGDDDQIVPIAASAQKAVELLPQGTLKVYPGAPHGIYGEFQVQLDQDLLAFFAG